MTEIQLTEKDPSLEFSCPVCGAAPLEKCEMNNGGARFESHGQRKENGEELYIALYYSFPRPEITGSKRTGRGSKMGSGAEPCPHFPRKRSVPV
jgi:hypothetical protein